jgi:solute:Na+ symporter, SSS family
MVPELNWVATAVFIFFLAVVTLIGLLAGRWRQGDLGQIEEWGLAGRRFGTIVTWFLVGGDFYTAYTLIAVPALVYGAGAIGFFALPFTIIVYPFVYAVMPRLWRVSHRHNYVTLADFVHGRYGGHWLALAIAVTGILATIPYIALQLVGIQVSIAALGFHGSAWSSDIPLVIAFLILVGYDYTSGLRGPTLISFVKGVMVYIVVLAAVIWIPLKLGGYDYIFHVASQVLGSRPTSVPLILPPQQYLPFASLALGSALGVFLYPHLVTSILSSSSGTVIRRNAILLPAFTFLLGLVALLGYVAIAAGVHVTRADDIVPAIFRQLFPPWFSGFCLASIAIGALVPAAIMSIACANLFTRNIFRQYIKKDISHRQESALAKVFSLLVKLGALAFVLFGNPAYAINLQLLGGIWILQTLPTAVFGLYTRWFHKGGLLAGWLAGMIVGSVMAWSQGLRTSIYPLKIDGVTISAYAAVDALLVNLLVAVALTLLLRASGVESGSDETLPADYVTEPRRGSQSDLFASPARAVSGAASGGLSFQSSRSRTCPRKATARRSEL